MRFSSNKKGFTLVEILVVLILLAMAGSLVFVNVGKSVGVKREKAFSEEMVSLCKKARRKAVDEGVPKALKISSSQRICWVDGGEKTLKVPAEMLIQGEGVRRLDDDVYTIHFYPDGSSDGGELRLSVEGRRAYVFRVDMLTGMPTRVEEEV